jgi:hypothetical protein
MAGAGAGGAATLRARALRFAGAAGAVAGVTETGAEATGAAFDADARERADFDDPAFAAGVTGVGTARGGTAADGEGAAGVFDADARERAAELAFAAGVTGVGTASGEVPAGEDGAEDVESRIPMSYKIDQHTELTILCHYSTHLGPTLARCARRLRPRRDSVVIVEAAEGHLLRSVLRWSVVLRLLERLRDRLPVLDKCRVGRLLLLGVRRLGSAITSE